jgi:hypothetical protein
LLVEAEEGVGKKMLLVKWIEHHRQNNQYYPLTSGDRFPTLS